MFKKSTFSWRDSGSCLIVSAALLLMASVVQAGTFAVVDLPATGTDAATGIDAAKTYTHTFDCGSGSPVTINGVVFEQGPTASFTATHNGTSRWGYGYTISDTRASVQINIHAGNDPSAQADGSSAEMLRDMIYHAASTTIGAGMTLTLRDLIPGVAYSSRYYYRSWGSGATARTITVNADGDDDGAFDDTIDIEIDGGGAHYLEYQFVADDTDVTIQFITNDDNNGVHLYGFSNEVDGPLVIAYHPTPADGSLYVGNYVSLTWEVGDTAETQDIYFGTNYDDVANGTGGTFARSQAASTKWFVVGAGLPGDPLPGGLVSGETYYWRVDQVEADGVTKHTGNVWSFSVPSSKAYDPQPVDGAKYVDPGVQLTWTAGLNAVLHTVYFGEDYDTVANATEGGVPAGTASFDPPIALEKGKTYYWRVDERDTVELHKGDVWSFEVIPVISITDPNLIGWWKLDEGMGEVAVDWSGHENHGTIHNPSGGLGDDGSVWDEDADHGMVLSFDGDETGGAYVDAGSIPAMDMTNGFTWSFWSKQSGDGTGVNQTMLGNRYGGTASPLQFVKFTPTNFEYYNDGTTMFIDYDDLPADVWLHHAVVKDGASLTYYRNGAAVGSSVVTANMDANPLYIGGDAASERWRGWIYSVRIYDKALTPEDVRQSMRSDPWQAWDPGPASSAVVDIRETTAVTWAAGDFASQHDVYWGATRDAVEAADTGSAEYEGRQSGTVYQLAGLIEFGGGPYYWRIDEINTDATITKGRVWSFSVADHFVIDDFEDYNNFTPDRVFETWLDGWGDSTNGSIVGYPDPNFEGGETFVETSIVHGGGQSMPYYYDNNMKYSEATMTLEAPNRDWTTNDIKALSMWYYGYAASLGSFAEGPAGTYTMTGAGEDIWGTADQFHFAYKMLSGPGSITARVDEIIANDDDVWVKGGVMIRDTLDPNSSFAGLYITSGSGCRYQARTDTAISATSDSSVTTLAHIVAPHWIRLERDISGNFNAYDSNDGVTWYPLAWNPVNIQMGTNVYIGPALTSHTGGLQATAVFSNVSTTGNVSGATFTNQDIGIQSNGTESMFVSIKDAAGRTATVYNADPNAVNVTGWTEWGEYGEGIALSEFTAQTAGLDLSNVDTLSIGFGTKGNTQPGGGGLMFFDDVRLYSSRCIPELIDLAGDLNDDCVVDMPDLEMLTDQWLAVGPDIEADLNVDEVVDFMDYAILSDGWLDEQLWP